jgi:hypothetical protein
MPELRRMASETGLWFQVSRTGPTGDGSTGSLMKNRRKIAVALFVALMGLIAFYNEASSPRFADIRGIDVVRLLAAGMCFGAAVATVFGLLLFRERPSS